MYLKRRYRQLSQYYEVTACSLKTQIAPSCVIVGFRSISLISKTDAKGTQSSYLKLVERSMTEQRGISVKIILSYTGVFLIELNISKGNSFISP